MENLNSDAEDSDVSVKKYSILCTNVPDDLFNAEEARKHFGKFGRVVKIILRPKKQTCLVEYDTYNGASMAILNAGAFDGFEFNVTWEKRKRVIPKKDDDPDWKPDPEVEEELRAMSGGELIRSPRLHKATSPAQQKSKTSISQRLNAASLKKANDSMPIHRNRANMLTSNTSATSPRHQKSRISLRQRPSAGSMKKANDIMPVYRKHPSMLKPNISGNKTRLKVPATIIKPHKRDASPVQISQIPATVSLQSITEAITELRNLKTRQARNIDDKYRILEIRDRCLRVIGGAGSRDPGGGAIKGTCPDMCPEKERLRREVENQVASFECTSNVLNPLLAIKQYSRSSADQEAPMCYELRPPAVLKRTMLYLLHKIAGLCDNQQDLDEAKVSEWFHFMWDRLRGIRKDITQQALCCEDSLHLLEQCARFHAHCSARLAGYDKAMFDQRLNSDNLTKCLQTLKHMYHDMRVRGESLHIRRNEPEFRGYIALLNLGDANFMWEVQQLEPTIQQSPEIKFSIDIFTALDNNNYIKFFRLVRKASYLQACILLRYFNDVRARALARIVKAYVPKGQSTYPAHILMENLAFENLNSMELFLKHYGLEITHTNFNAVVNLDKTAFCDESDPYPVDRAPVIIESKLNCEIGRMLAGGILENYSENAPYESFDGHGFLKVSSLLAEDQGYKLPDDATISSLRNEFKTSNLKKTTSRNEFSSGSKSNIFSSVINTSKPSKKVSPTTTFAKPGIEKTKTTDNIFKQIATASPPTQSSMFTFKPAMVSQGFPKVPILNDDNQKNLFVFSKPSDGFSFNESKTTNVVKSDPFLNATSPTSIFSNANKFTSSGFASNEENIFGKISNAGTVKKSENIFSKPSSIAAKSSDTTDNVFKVSEQQKTSSVANLFAKSENAASLFSKPLSTENIFSKSSDSNNAANNNIFSKKPNLQSENSASIFNSGRLLESASPAINIFGTNSIAFGQTEEANLKIKIEQEKRAAEEKRQREKEIKEEEERKQIELKKLEEEKRQKEIKRKEQQKLLELKKREEEQKLLELKKREEERKALELIEQKAEEERKCKIKEIEKRAEAMLSDLIEEVNEETVKEFIKTELRSLSELVEFVDKMYEKVVSDVCNEECYSALKSEDYNRKRLIKKWGNKWRTTALISIKRKKALSDMPIWLPAKSLKEEAQSLRKSNLQCILSNMHDFHRGYKRTSVAKPPPTLGQLNVFEMIKQPLLYQTKQSKTDSIKSCIFWKAIVSLPDNDEITRNWTNLHDIVQFIYSSHQSENHSLYLKEHHWHKRFAISIDKVIGSNNESLKSLSHIIDTANAIVVYINNNSVLDVVDQRIEELLNFTCLYQVVPVAVIAPGLDADIICAIEKKLKYYVDKNIISAFKVFGDLKKSFNLTQEIYSLYTAKAMAWLARKLPLQPTLEIDYLHDVLHQCIGNELWYRLKSEQHSTIKTVLCKPVIMCELFNEAVNKTKALLSNENIYNYPSFPEEFQQFLPEDFVYPNSYEYFPNDWKSSFRIQNIVETLNSFYLPNITSVWPPKSAAELQDWIRTFCIKCLWFPNPEEVTVKIISLLPYWLNEPSTDEYYFNNLLSDFGLQSLFSLIVKVKIDIEVNKAAVKLAIYEKNDLIDYRSSCWWYDIPKIAASVPEICQDDDFIDEMINEHNQSKRRKLMDDSFNENDASFIESALKLAETSIKSYKQCTDLCDILEGALDRQRKKALETESRLVAALNI